MDDRTTAGAGSPGTPAPACCRPDSGEEFVTETLGYDGGGQVTVYVPPDTPEAVVFAGTVS